MGTGKEAAKDVGGRGAWIITYRYEIYLEGWYRHDWFCEDAYFVAKIEKLEKTNFRM